MIDERGRVVGVVTSCSVDSEGYQTGQAYLKEAFNSSGTAIAVFAGSAQARPDRRLNELDLGDRVTMPEAAEVLSRFPKRK